METANKFVLWAAMCTEAMNVLYDLRWMIVFIVAFILSDLRFGIKESIMRNEKVRTSRAIRRTCNKAVDYFTYLVLGSILGLAILEPLDITNHTISAALGLSIGGICEINSIIGHVCVLHGMKKFSFTKFSKRFFILLVKKKSKDVGEVIEQINNEKDENN